MPTKRVIKVRSKFEDGFLKSFELLSVTPEFPLYENFATKGVRASFGYSTYFSDVLWIDTEQQQKKKYFIGRSITRDVYNRYFKCCNAEQGITVIDINRNILGEL